MFVASATASSSRSDDVMSCASGRRSDKVDKPGVNPPLFHSIARV